MIVVDVVMVDWVCIDVLVVEYGLDGYCVVSLICCYVVVCVVLFICGLVMVESECYFFYLLLKLEVLFDYYGLVDVLILLCLFGCLNGCLWFYLGEIVLVGCVFGCYDLCLGVDFCG